MHKNKSSQQSNNKSHLNIARNTRVNKSTSPFKDNRAEANRIVKLQHKANSYISSAKPIIQKKKNNTGLPDSLKKGVENLSGYSMDDVKVHYNSNKPAQLQAHAFAQGTNIHIAAGQEKHLPHEAWHVVQQKQGRVKPTLQMKGNVAVNDDITLEREADQMGEKALQMHRNATINPVRVYQFIPQTVIQRAPTDLSEGEQVKPGPPPTVRMGSYFYKVFTTKASADAMESTWADANSLGVLTPAYRVEQVRHNNNLRWAFRSRAVAGTFFQFSKAGHTQRVVDWINLQTSTRYLGRLRSIFTKVRTDIGDGQGFFENADNGNIWFIDINTAGTSPNAQDVVAAINARIEAL